MDEMGRSASERERSKAVGATGAPSHGAKGGMAGCSSRTVA